MLKLTLSQTSLVAPTASLADHIGRTGVGGGRLNLARYAGRRAVGLRLAYTRPERLSDSELALLASQAIHAPDYNLNGSLGVAYGITGILTVSLELT